MRKIILTLALLMSSGSLTAHDNAMSLDELMGAFGWNMATYDLREAVNLSAMEVGPEVDEFAHAGVTPTACVDAPGPRVAESPAHFECRYLSTHRLRGSSTHGWVDVVYGEVVRIHVDDAVVT